MKIKKNILLSYMLAAYIAATIFMATPSAASVFIIHPDSTQSQTQNLSIPVTINNSSFSEIYAIELNIAYDSNVLTATGISLVDTVLENDNYLFEYNVNIPGMIYLLFASSTSLSTGTGLLLNLNFTVQGDAGETSDIILAKAIFNNDNVSVSNGTFAVMQNTLPTFTGIASQTGNEDTTISMNFTIHDNESNPCDIPLTIESSDETLLPNSAITFSCVTGDINLLMTPLTNQSGVATLTITATDNALKTVRSFNLTVTEINDAPVLNNPISNRIATEGTPYAFTFDANTFDDVDPDDVLTYIAKQSNGNALPAWLSFNSATRTFSGTPLNTDVGTIVITITATDTSSEAVTDTFELTVNNTNSGPVLVNPIADQTATEDVLFSFNFSDNTFKDDDVAHGDTISYFATLSNGNPLPSWLSFDSNNRSFSGTPLNSDVGLISISVTAKDTLNLSTTDTFNLTVENVNDSPSISNIVKNGQTISNTGLTIDEDTMVDNISFTISDIDDSNLTLMISSSNTSLLPNSNIIHTCNNNSCNMSLSPALNKNGSAIITITVSDPLGFNASNMFNLTVSPVNDQPVASTISQQIIDEDQSVSGLSLTVTDVEDLPCSFDISASSSNTSLIPNTNISHTCSAGVYLFNITPIGNQNGNSTITIIATDSQGQAASTAFNISVTPINDPPTLSDISPQSMNESETIQVAFSVNDIDSATLTVSAVSTDQALISNSNLVITNIGNAYKIAVTPNNYQIGQAEITVSASDGIDTTTKTFAITVNEMHYTISGHVSSYTANIATGDIKDVVMALSGTYSYSTITDASGNYVFQAVRPGSYTLTASKTNDISLDLADAIKLIKGAVKLINLSCYEQIAADAYIDGYFGAFDAAKVARYVGGIENCLNNDCTFWQFIPEEISNCETWHLIEIDTARHYNNLNGDVSGQNFIGIGCGNVSQ